MSCKAIDAITGEKLKNMKMISHYEYLGKSRIPYVKDTLAKYKRGDFDYMTALEMISVYLHSIVLDANKQSKKKLEKR